MTMNIDPNEIRETESTRIALHSRDLEAITALLDRRAIDALPVIDQVADVSIAAPSWAVGTGGTRFGRFPRGGEPRTTEEKLDDIAALNALTGANRSVSLHVPWDSPEHPLALREYAAALGLTFDAMNSNTFQDNPSTTHNGRYSYKFGSFASNDAGVRHRALEHNLEVVELGEALGADAITVWLGDGSNHPGQADFRRQFDHVAQGMRALHDLLPDHWAMLTEHKPYEPAFYSTVNADWGSSLLLAQQAGPKAKCLVDLGHHLPNANIEQIVSRLAMVQRLGGFHFNDSKYGDDDLTVGSINPFQLFLIACELVAIGDGSIPELRYMIDASHNVKDPIEDLIQSTDQIQIAFAQALIVDRDELRDAQDHNDAARAAEVLHAAFRCDVRPLVAQARLRNGAAIHPLQTFRDLRYRDAATSVRGSDAIATGL
jgi:L-rhamnose isomerase / sugar isomerase